MLLSTPNLFYNTLSPCLVRCSDLYLDRDWLSFWNATSLFDQFVNLHRKYAHVKTEKIWGYELYEGSRDETTFHQERIHLSSAALFQPNFDVESLVQYIGGPHIAAHWNIAQIRDRISKRVDQVTLNWLIHGYVYSLRFAQTTTCI